MRRALIRRIATLLVLSGMAAFVFVHCAKDPDMVVSIYVKLKDDSTVVVPDARVVLSKEDVEVVGYTDANGKFTHTFKLKMMLDVEATKDTLMGRTTLRLGDPGSRYRKTVFIY